MITFHFWSLGEERCLSLTDIIMGLMLRTAVLALLLTSQIAAAEYNVGVGIADVTGPAAEINMVHGTDWEI